MDRVYTSTDPNPDGGTPADPRWTPHCQQFRYYHLFFHGSGMWWYNFWIPIDHGVDAHGDTTGICDALRARAENSIATMWSYQGRVEDRTSGRLNVKFDYEYRWTLFFR
jgi:hypothetical protein